MKKTLFTLTLVFALIYPFSVFSQNTNVENEQTDKIETLYDVKEVYKDFRIAIGGGYAYRLGKILKTGDTQLDNLSKDLRGGFNIDADLQYFFKEHWGLGLNVNYASANVSGNDLYIPNVGSANTFEETNRFIYVGPSFATRYEFSKFLLVLNVGFGPMFFNVTDRINGAEASVNKVAFASQVSAAIEYKITNNIGLGIKMGVAGGTVKFDGIDEKFSASNFLIGGYISFRTWE